MTAFININGRLHPAGEAAVPAGNRAYRFGYGLFETMLVREGRIRLEMLHWQRLFKGLKLLDISVPQHFQEELARELVRTVQKNGLEQLCRVRLQISAGEGGLYDGTPFSAAYVIEVLPLEPSILRFNQTGLVVGIAEAVKSSGAYANLKSCSALPYAMAARQARENLWDDALLKNEKGNIIESSIGNLFWVKDGHIYTPPLSDGCVAGVMRQHLLNVLPGHGYNVEEMELTPELLREADCVFLSNSIRGIKWVHRINSEEYDQGELEDVHKKLLKSL